MKGRTSNTRSTSCYASGGSVKEPAEVSKFRPVVRKHGKITVDGKAARPRLDRPGRKMRADGGSTLSRDSRDEALRLRQEDETDNRAMGRGLVGVQIPGGIGIGTALAARTRLGKAAGAALAGYGASNIPSVNRAIDEQDHRRSEIKRIERGQAEPGKEDRKHGGKVK